MAFPEGQPRDFGDLVRQLFTASRVMNSSSGREYPLLVGDPSTIRITSGTLIIRDPDTPFADADDLGFSIPVRSGQLPLENAALVENILDPKGHLVDYPRVAIVRISVQDEAVARWSRATTAQGEPDVVLVDHGFLSFWDLDARAAVEHLQDSLDELDQLERSIRLHGNLMPTIVRDGHHLVVAKAGPGADNYPIWFGLTHDDEVGQIVVEMLPFDWTRAIFGG